MGRAQSVPEERSPCWLQCGTGCLWLDLRLDQELSTDPVLRLLALQSQITAAPRSYPGSGMVVLPAGKHCTAQPASPSAHSSASLIRQIRASSKAPEFNWTQFITSLSSVQIISSHQPRSGGHQQGLTDLRGRVALFSGWIVPTNLPQAELPAAKLYFPPWPGETTAQVYICISV